MRVKGIVLAVLALLVGACAAQASPSPDPGIHWESYLPDFPPVGPQPGHVPGCQKPSLKCIDTEIRKMRAAQKRFGCDHRGVFDTTYLELTLALRDAVVKQPNLFINKGYLFTEDALFADYYFRTLNRYAAGRYVPPAWKIALDTATKSDGVNAAQDMLLGINAHVQNDMPFVVAALGLTTRKGASRKPDHDAVNEVLAQAYERVVQAVSSRFDPFVAMTNASWDPADDIAGLEMVREWREQVWRSAERLLQAKSDAERRQVGVEIQQNAASWAQGIATEAQPGYRATRDAYCKAQLSKPPKTVASRHT
jgi:hypothetical protein